MALEHEGMAVAELVTLLRSNSPATTEVRLTGAAQFLHESDLRSRKRA
jgi:hypothetical protein